MEGAIKVDGVKIRWMVKALLDGLMVSSIKGSINLIKNMG